VPSFTALRVSLILIVIFVSAEAQDSQNKLIPTQIPSHDDILMGTAWYPEQWPESRWEGD
jgi:hypothetical protein